ncbi:unnamed protein product, partial [marine sediment metagenome]
YDVTAAAYVVQPTNLISDDNNIFRTPFVPLFVTADRYKLRFEFTDTTAGRILIVDKIGMSPDSNAALVPFEQKTVQRALATTATGVLGYSETESTGHAYRDSNGKYRLVFNIAATHDSDSSFIINIPGVVFDATASFFQSCSVASNIGTAVARAFTNPNSDGITLEYSAGVTSTRISGDVGLASKPDWFDANLDDNKVNLLTQDVVTQNSRMRLTFSGTTAAIAPNTELPWDVETDNEGGGFTLSAGLVICNFNGFVITTARINATANT